MADPLFGLNPEVGLHVLKDKWGHKSFLGEQSERLCLNLSQAMESTKKSAPRRSRRGMASGKFEPTEHYQLSRGVSVAIDSSERERRWERAAFIRWSVSGLSPVGGCWSRLVAFQVPLFACELKEGWGYIDLLGILDDSTLSIIELKKEPTTTGRGITAQSESPLKIVIQAAAYAVAVQADWDGFRPEFVSRLRSLGISDTKVPKHIRRIQIVAAAPAAYWLDWLPVTAKGRQISSEAWQSFSSLLKALDQNGLPVSFLSLSGEPDRPESLAVQPLLSFPINAASCG